MHPPLKTKRRRERGERALPLIYFFRQRVGVDAHAARATSLAPLSTLGAKVRPVGVASVGKTFSVGALISHHPAASPCLCVCVSLCVCVWRASTSGWATSRSSCGAHRRSAHSAAGRALGAASARAADLPRAAAKARGLLGLLARSHDDEAVSLFGLRLRWQRCPGIYARAVGASGLATSCAAAQRRGRCCRLEGVH